MRDPISFLREEYQELVEKALDWRLKKLEGASEPVTTVDGREVLVLCSNNYLGLATHPKLKQAALETIRAEEASVQKLFGDAGGSVKNERGRSDYEKKFSEALSLVSGVFSGRKPARLLQEAMTTSDFPKLFGDILDRQLLANYKVQSMPFRKYVKISTEWDHYF